MALLPSKEISNGGHTILDNSGTSMAQQPNLQFKGMSVENDGNNSKTVVTPYTPDYVDAQYSSTTTYTKGMTCISGNKRYRSIYNGNNQGNTPPNAAYWVEESVASEVKALETHSETEEVIGTFLGKTLYRKVFKVNLTLPAPTDNPNYIAHLVSMPTGYISKLDAVLDVGNNMILQTSSGGDIVIMWSNYNNGQIVIYHKNVTSTPTVVKAIIAEYTKEKWT